KGKAIATIPGFDGNRNTKLVDFNKLPWPEDNDVSRYKYALQGEPNCEYREIQAYASRGCVYRCNFCAAANLYYNKPNWRPRDVQDIVNEIIYLKNKYPEMQGIFFDEEWHNYRKDFILELCKKIKENKIDNLHYNAMCGYSTMNKEMLEAMKDAGYYKLRIGIETLSDKIADAMNLGGKFNQERLYKVLEMAKNIGLKIYATFTIGGRGATRDEDNKTAEFIRESVARGWICDLQVSIATPQPGTPFYKWAQDNGYIIRTEWSQFDGGNYAVVSYPDYQREEIEAMFRIALFKYDGGRYERDGRYIKNRVLNELKRYTINKAICFRTNRMWHIWSFLDAICEVLKDKRIDFIIQPAVKEIFEKDKRINRIYIYDKGFFNRDIFPEELFNTIKYQSYDTAIIFVNHPEGKGYDNVYNIAKDSAIPQILYIFPDGGIKKK
ncbi:MAG: radical SAM protein, partial [Candidatus Hydrogenedentota bacterium]